MIEPFMDIKAPSPPVDPPGDLKSVNSLVFVDNKLFDLRNSLTTGFLIAIIDISICSGG